MFPSELREGESVIVLLSGGMDSVTALYEAAKRYKVAAGLSFHYGSKHNDKELPCAATHCRKLGIHHEIIAIDFIDRLFRSDLLKSGGSVPDGHYQEESMKRTVVPFRNGIMLSIAAGYAESLDVRGLVIAAHTGDHAIYPDCREPFMAAMAEALRAGTYARIELLRPFIGLNKAQIVQRGTVLEVDYGLTWSCYKGGEAHCGTCGTCVERKEAFLVAGVVDPTRYLG